METTGTCDIAGTCENAQKEIDAAMGLADRRILSHSEVALIVNKWRTVLGLPVWTAEQFEENILTPARKASEAMAEQRKKAEEAKAVQVEAAARQGVIRKLEDDKKIATLQAEVAALKEAKKQ